jgi:Carboxypeptidase regulatory-like domain
MVFGLMDFQVHIPRSVNHVAAHCQRPPNPQKLEESMRRESLLARSVSLLFGALFLLSFACFTSFGQAGTSTVRGTVTDPQGNVVAGATLTLTDTNKNSSRTATSEDTGAYRFELVPVGDYRLEVEAKGFKKSVVSSVHAAVGSSNPVDVKLEVGNVSETVTITGGGSETLINKEDATLGNVFVNQQITQLPILGRSIPSLLTLQPGVTRDGSVTGSRADQSNITLDGVDINEQQTNSIGAVTDNATTSQLPTGNTVLRLNAEAIQEFRVVTTNPNASQGRSAGAQVEVVSKGGTNEFHGSAFWFHRPTRLSANDFFNNRIGLKRPTLIRNNYGWAAGGPIKKDRAFFFYSYEADRRVTQTGVSRTVPMASLGQGLVRYTNPSGGITSLTPAQMLAIFPSLNGENAAAVAALAAAAQKYPANDCNGGDKCVNTGTFRFNAATPVQLNSHAAKFDINITDHQQLFARANVNYDKTVQAPNFPDTPSPGVWSHPMGIAIGHNWTINNNMVNHFVYGYTREAFSQQGDSADNSISFRFVFSPRLFTRDVIRITPVHNFVDDLSLTRGNHTWQVGANIRAINNVRTSFANAFDSAVTNPSFYAGAGTTISNAVNAFSALGSGQASIVQNAATAVLGRFSQYTAAFTFGHDGSLQSAGTPSVRNLATQEYEGYIQDSWKMKPNLTLNLGLRYSLSRPVYEKNGFEVKPNIPLADYFARRLAAAKAGVDFTDAITMQLSGPANNASPLYHWDKNNFQPVVSLAWSPHFTNSFLRKIFANGGDGQTSVVRGGFRVLNDSYGEQIAVTFDLNNSLGFTSNTTIAANTFNTTTKPAPLFTGYGQAIRPLQGIVLPGNLTFPQQKPLDFSRRIESSFDENLKAPTEYSWNLVFERTLPHGLGIQAGYVGRAARNLLATRDVMALNDLVDPKSGADWYTAAGTLEQLRAAGTPVGSVAPIPYFENMFPGIGAQYLSLYTSFFGASTANAVFAGATNSTQAIYASALRFNSNDWTTIQDDLESATGKALFYQEQYGALSAWGSIAKSNYHAGVFSIRERLGRSLIMDLNYTLSHSLDDASGLQTSGTFGGAFVLNPILQKLSYANSDFDFRHVINANAVWEMPFGRGRYFGHSAGRWADMAIGGWQMTGIMRWNSGAPAGAPFDDARWATNWNVQSNGVRIRPIEASPCRGNATVAAKLFCDTTTAYQSWRNARPGEAGDRNVIRNVGYFALDMGLAKSLKFTEKVSLQLRFEAFNVTNTQRMGAFDASRTGFGLTVNPSSATPPANWSNYTAIQGAPRQMQFGARLTF